MTTAKPHLLDDIADIDVPTPKREGPPLIHWYNAKDGRPPMFYTKLSHYDGAEPADPWQDADFFEEAAFYVDAEQHPLRIQVMGYRSQPYLREEDRWGNKKKVWLSEYTDGARIQTDLLILMEGYDLPVIWTFTGMTGKAMLCKDTGIIPRYRNGLLKAASNAQRRRLPLWTFWLPIGVLLTPKGKVDFIKTSQGGTYTPPDLRLPKGDIDAQMAELYVGRERYIIATELWREFDQDGWFKQRRDVGATDEPAEAPPARVAQVPADDSWNGPDTGDDDDIPF